MTTREEFDKTLGPVSPPMHQRGARCDVCGAAPLAHWWTQSNAIESRVLCETCFTHHSSLITDHSPEGDQDGDAAA